MRSGIALVKCVKVSKWEAQKLKEKLVEHDNLNRNYRTASEDGFVFFPVKRKFEGKRIIERKLLRTNRKVESLKEALSRVLSKKQVEKVVKSFDVLGELAVVEIPESLREYEKTIGNAVMKVHGNVRTVAAKRGPMEGEFRVRKLEVIAGEKRTETEYKESGCVFHLDPAKVYFSPRLSFERERTAGLVRKNENVMVMFAGVGPFPIVISKRNPGAIVVAVELNPSAFEYMVKNIKSNKVDKRVTPVFGDVRVVLPELFSGWADRVLMPLPKGAEEFMDVALVASKKNAVIHTYCFSKTGEEKATADKILKKIKGLKRKAEIMGLRTVRPFAPHVDQIVIDFKIKN